MSENTEKTSVFRAHHPTVRRRFQVGDRELRLDVPADTDALVRAEEHAGDAEKGYWAELWPSAIVLGAFLDSTTLIGPGQRVLEIGCGVGICGIIAAMRGCNVTLSDRDPRGVELAARNANLNHAPCMAETIDWNHPLPPECETPDVIIGSDVLYFPASHAPIARLIATTDSLAILCDPNRRSADGALDAFAHAGLACWVRPVPGGRLFLVQAEEADSSSS